VIHSLRSFLEAPGRLSLCQDYCTEKENESQVKEIFGLRRYISIVVWRRLFSMPYRNGKMSVRLWFPKEFIYSAAIGIKLLPKPKAFDKNHKNFQKF